MDSLSKQVAVAKVKAMDENATLFEKEHLKSLTADLDFLQRDELMIALKNLERRRKKRAEMAGKSR